MEENLKSSSVVLNEQEVEWLWADVVQKFVSNTKEDVSASKMKSAIEFWKDKTIKRKFYEDFKEKTKHDISQIELESEKGAKEDIPDVYIRNHLIYRNIDKFQYGYLGRILFYIYDKKIDWVDYRNTKSNDPNLAEESDDSQQNILPQGVTYLEGYWISFNGNIDAGHYAQCFYYFQSMGSTVTIEKDGYGAETKYCGEVAIQADSSYLFELTGETRKLRKFVIADVGKIKPDVMTCFSSAFGIDNNQPILAKEILIRLPESFCQPLDGGIMIKHQEVDAIIEKYYQNDEKTKILAEIEAFLGTNEVPYFSLHNLKNIKKHHLEKIEIEKVAEPKVLKKQSIYVHFNRLSFHDETYLRNVVKYFNLDKDKVEFEKYDVKVADEYTLLRICQYNKEEIQKHKVRFEAEDGFAGVDIQALFPIVDDSFDNGRKKPDLRYSNLVIDAFSDTFVSSATFVNDFSKTKRIAVHFEEITLKNELVFDFSSIEDFDKLNIGIDYISYYFNEPDTEGMQEIRVDIKNTDFKGATLQAIDRKAQTIEIDESLVIDRSNPKIFAIKMLFPAMKDEILYVHFKLDAQSDRK